MAGKYWIKLFHDTLYDPKMDRLDPLVYKRAIQCFLMAGEYDKGGLLPSVADMAYIAREDEKTLIDQLHELRAVGILDLTEQGWLVVNFNKRQGAMSAAERQRRRRNDEREEQYYGEAGKFTPETKTRSDIVVPEGLKTERFNDAWNLWMSHLSERKRRLSPTQVNAILAELGDMGEERAIKAIQYSVRRGWLSIYEEKPRDNQGRFISADDRAGELAWGRVLNEIKRVSRDGQPDLDQDTTKAINMAGGWKTICTIKMVDAKQAFLSAYGEVTNE
jgi:hypothetical protein